MIVQSIWHRAKLFSRKEASAWCSSHDFKTDVYRSKSDDDGEVVFHIHAQFDPSEAVDDSWKIISDTFPEGISASVCERKEKSMKKQVIKGRQSADDPFEFIMSDESVDRMGDVIVAKGWDLRKFRKNPIALGFHNHGMPIGNWENVRIVGKKLIGKLHMAAAGTSAEIDTIRSLLEQRIIRAVSVGFSPTEYKETKTGYRFIKQILDECSLVSVGANANALAIAKSHGLGSDQLRQLLSNGQNAAPGKKKALTKTGTPLATSKRKPVMDITKRIAAKKERLVAIKDDLTVLKALLDEDGYEHSDDEIETIDVLTDEEETVIKSIASLEKLEQGLAKRAEPVSGNIKIPRAGGPAAKVDEKGGMLLTQVALAHVFSHVQKKSLEQVISERFPKDDRITEVIKAMEVMKTATPLATTTLTGWAAELVSEDTRAFLTDLAPYSIYAGLRLQGMALDFGGANSITIPSRGGNNTDLAGAFVGEGGVIPVKSATLQSQRLERYKMAVISATSNELLRASNPSIMAVMHQGMLEDTAIALDTAFLDSSAAVAGIRPAGLLAGVTETASAGPSAANIITDIKVLLTAMVTANLGAKPVLIMNSLRLLGLSTVTSATGDFQFRDEVASMRLLGIPVLASSTVPADKVLIVDAASFASANDVPEFMVSDQATLTMANSDASIPTQAAADATNAAKGTAEQVPPLAGVFVNSGKAAGPDAVGVGAQAVSLYQTYSTALRMVLPTSWGLIRPHTVAGLKTVAW